MVTLGLDSWKASNTVCWRDIVKKKMASLALSLVLIFSFTQSAFATVGFADDYYSAYVVGPMQAYQGHITTSTDSDWFKWTNTTGSAKVLSVILVNSGQQNYDLEVAYAPPGVNIDTLQKASDNGPGGIDSYSVGSLPHNWTIYWRVKGHDSSQYSSTVPYITWIHVQ